MKLYSALASIFLGLAACTHVSKDADQQSDNSDNLIANGFALSIDQTRIEVNDSGLEQLSVTLRRINPSISQVNLNLIDLPMQIKASYQKSVVFTQNTMEEKINLQTNNALPGEYLVKMVASSGAITRQKTFTLKIKPNTSITPNFLSRQFKSIPNPSQFFYQEMLTTSAVNQNGGILYTLGAGEYYRNSSLLTKWLITKHDKSRILWTKEYDIAQNADNFGLKGGWFPIDAKVDTQGNLFVLGKYNQNLQQNILIVKFDTDGNLISSKNYDVDSSMDVPFALDIDNADNLYVSGLFYRNDSRQNAEGFAMKINKNTQKNWILKLDNNSAENNEDFLTDIVADGNGIYVSGCYTGDAGSVRQQGQGDIYFAKLNPVSGEPIWQNMLGTSQNDCKMFLAWPPKLAKTANSSLYLGHIGDFSNEPTQIKATNEIRSGMIGRKIAQTEIINEMQSEHILSKVAKIDEVNGNVLLDWRIQPGKNYLLTDLKVDGQGKIYVAGKVSDSTFANTRFYRTVNKFEPNGNPLWQQQSTDFEPFWSADNQVGLSLLESNVLASGTYLNYVTRSYYSYIDSYDLSGTKH